jgi:hypothetical protein
MRRLRGSLIAAGILSCAVLAPAADDFYEAQMRAGEQALAAGRAAESADALRIASFGLLEKPALLSRCLAELAVAQTRARRPSEADKTLQRFRAVQALFPAQADLSSTPPDVRAAFEAFARQRVPGFTLRPGASTREARRAPGGSP